METDNIDQATERAMEFFNANKDKYRAAMRTIQKAIVSIQPVEVKEHSEAFVLFSNKKIEVTGELQ